MVSRSKRFSQNFRSFSQNRSKAQINTFDFGDIRSQFVFRFNDRAMDLLTEFIEIMINLIKYYSYQYVSKFFYNNFVSIIINLAVKFSVSLNIENNARIFVIFFFYRDDFLVQTMKCGIINHVHYDN